MVVGTGTRGAVGGHSTHEFICFLFVCLFVSVRSLGVSGFEVILKDTPKEKHVDQAKKLSLANQQLCRSLRLKGLPKLEVTSEKLDQMLSLDTVGWPLIV